MLRRLFGDLATVAACAIGLIVCSSELFAQQDYQPKIAAASGDAELALKGFVVPEDMSGRLMAAEPMTLFDQLILTLYLIKSFNL